MQSVYMPNKRTLGIVALAVVVIVPLAALLIVPHVIDTNKYHKQIQSQLERRLGRKVSMTQWKAEVGHSQG